MTFKDVEAFALEAILSVNKNEIVKLWHEKLMLMYPTMEQHEMVLFHDRWFKTNLQIKKTLKKCKEDCVRKQTV